jgi:hypothetical protein
MKHFTSFSPFVALTLAVFIHLQGCGKPPTSESDLSERWNPANDPWKLDPSYERTLRNLPLSGQAAERPWSDTYWPDKNGGIANRWSGAGTAPWNQPLPTLEQVQRMSYQQIATLSPAEKYDIYNGRFDYPFTRGELARAKPTAVSWAGICHGWAPASINYLEPRPVTLRSPQGINVPFGSSDVKALLSYYDARVDTDRGKDLGERCDKTLSNSTAHLPECKDVNAGAFHIVLANQLGLRRRAFIADLTRDAQVWNQPIVRFASNIRAMRRFASPGAAPGTVAEYDIQTSMTYVIETGPNWQAIGSRQAMKTYQYRLELSGSGEIIGGEWYGSDRPDFLWTMSPPQSFRMTGLAQIYQAATGR